MIKLVILLLLACSMSALYEHQVGLQDWVVRQYGAIQQATLGSPIYFVSDSILGALDPQTGKILHSNQLMVKCAQREVDDHHYVYYDATQERIVLYKQKENVHSTLVTTSLSGTLQYCLLLKLNQYALVTKNQIMMVQGDAITPIETLREEQVVIASGMLQNQVPTLLIRSPTQVCVYEVGSTLSKRQCAPHSKRSTLRVHLMSDSYLFWDDSVAFLIGTTQVHTLIGHATLLSTSESIFSAQNTFVASVDRKLILYAINIDGAPQQLFEFATQSATFDPSPQGRHNPNLYYYVSMLEASKVGFHCFDSQTSSITNLGEAVVRTTSRPVRVFVRHLDNNKKVFLVQHQDLHTHYHAEAVQVWSSEQSLSQVAAVVWESFSDERTHRNSYFESLEKHGARNPLYLLQNVMLRWVNDFVDLVSYAQSVPDVVRQLLRDLYAKKQGAHQESAEYDITYGLRQKILIVTHLKTLLCFNSDDGSLLWKDSSMLGRMDASFQLRGNFKIEYAVHHDRNRLKIVHRQVEDTALHLSHLLVYYSTEKKRLNIFLLDSMTGDLQQVASQSSSNPVHLQSFNVDRAPHDNVVIIINEDGDIITYPKAPLEALGLGRDQPVLFYNFDGQTIKGFQFVAQRVVETWNHHIGQAEQVIKMRSSYSKSEEHPRVAVWDDRRVLFKLIDHSNFALLTVESNILHLRIINGKTGKVIFQGLQKNVDFSLPINLVFDENSVFVTYFNPSQSMYEIWSIESFHQKIEVSFLRILEDYYFNEKEETHLNYFETDLQAVFLQEVFGFPLGIKSLSIARTLKSLTKKNLLIITPENQINSLDRNLVSSRRRRNAQATTVPDDSFESLELPPYVYLLSTNYLTVLNYHQELNNLSQFHIQPTNLESTSLLLVTGQDLFFTRLSPDRTYDMIQTDFNYSFLLLTVVFIIALSQFMRSMAKKSKVLKVFYSS